MKDSDAQFEEDIVQDDEEEGGATALKHLREKLRHAVEEKQRYLENWQRERADFANYKREEEHRHASHELQIQTRFTEALIPVLDSFEGALQGGTFKDASAAWQQGIDALYQGLLSALKKMGIVQFAPKPGDPFDPYRHEALREVPTNKEEDDHTIEGVERSGYSIGDRIVRPAQVSVRTHTQ